MFDFLQGRRPDITAAQIAAVARRRRPRHRHAADDVRRRRLDAAQQDALAGALTWSAVLAAC